MFQDNLFNFIGIALSVVLGFTIGFERKMRFKEAGIRTHTIVCVGSALIMVVSKYGFGDSVEADASRVAAQIVSGIGFLGAGIIVYRQHEIHGLTTAAGVWATAGVGMAAGAQMYAVACFSAVVLIGIQCLFHLPWKIFRTKKFYQVRVCFEQIDIQKNKIKELFGVERFNKLEIRRRDGKLFYCVILNTDREFSSEHLNTIMSENIFISEIDRVDEQ